jgi:hypothetical protein
MTDLKNTLTPFQDPIIQPNNSTPIHPSIHTHSSLLLLLAYDLRLNTHPMNGLNLIPQRIGHHLMLIEPGLSLKELRLHVELVHLTTGRTVERGVFDYGDGRADLFL